MDPFDAPENEPAPPTTIEIVRQWRLELAALRKARRLSERCMATIEAGITLRIEGKNDTERKARLALALASDPDYCLEQEAFEALTLSAARVEADIAAFEDERREREWAIRDRAIAAGLSLAA